ncbi:MAG: RNA polymerase sigma factor [bacterium]
MSTGKLHVLPLGPKEEALLLEQLRDGASQASGAFELLYHHFIGRVLGLARQLLKDRAAAEDAAQETFLRVYRTIHRFRGDARLSTWIHRIAVNVCLSELDRRKRRSESPLEERAPRPAGAAATGGEVRLSLAQVLGRLEPQKQVVFYLCHVEGLSAAEAAEVVGESRDAVLKRLQRTRCELLAMWQEQPRDVAAETKTARGMP